MTKTNPHIYKSHFIRYADWTDCRDLLIRRIPDYEDLIIDTFAEIYEQAYTNRIEVKIFGKQIIEAIEKENIQNGRRI